MLNSDNYLGHGSQSKRVEWPKICKLGLHDLTSYGYVVVNNYPFFMKIHEYESAVQDLLGEIVKFQLSLKMKLLNFDLAHKPLMFILFMNDIVLEVKDSEFEMYV